MRTTKARCAGGPVVAILAPLLCATSLTFPAHLFSQEWVLESDVAVLNRYEWRGLQFDPGTTTQYSLYASAAWSDFILTTGIWSITDLSSEESLGLPHRWASEISPWIEAAVGENWNQVFAGVVGYWFRPPPSGVAPEREDTWEVYAGARGAVPSLPLIGEATLFWDPQRVQTGYGELAGGLQIPAWTGLIVPVGSIFLETRTGLSLGKERGGDDRERMEFLFEDAGFTHLDVSLRTTLLPVPIWSFLASLTLESRWTRGLDRATKRTVSRTGVIVDSTRWSWILGLRLTVPRCRPERELCRDL